MNKIYISFLLFLTACSTAPIITTPQIVKIPITVYCKTDPVPVPSLPFDEQAQAKMTLFQKSQLLAAQNEVYKGYVTQLQGAVDGCQPPSEAQIVGPAKP